ncbi:diguanylate cyclase [Shewanella atlantica]|uniref:diguanylate cyclase n=1 Tax=Shewanella atlantica TaxID=271099 RepID=UPI003735BF04
MNKQWLSRVYFLLISFGLCSALFSSSLFAIEQTDIDKVFDEIESGVAITPAELTEKIQYLKARISIDNVPHYFRLQSVLCWNHDTTDEKQRAEAIKLANTNLTSEKISQVPELLTDIKLCRAWFYQHQGRVEQALEEYNQLVGDAYQLESPKLIADVRSIRGAIYSFQGNFAQALEDLITAQHLYDSLELKYWSLYNLTELATSYRRFGDPQTAIKYYRQLEDKFIELGDMNSATGILSEMAIALEELGEYEQALDKYLRVYKYWTEQGSIRGASTIAVNMSGTLLKLNRIDEAKQYLNEANQTIKPDDEAFYSFMKLFEAQVHLMQADPAQALVELEEAKAAFSRVKNTRGMAQLLLLESQTFSTQQNWKQAFASLEQYLVLHNELDAKLQSNRTTEMRTRFNTKRIETENERLVEHQRIKEHELEIMQQNKLLQYVVLVLAFIIILIISLFAFKQAQKSKLLEVLAMTDHLTQLPNRRHTYATGEKLFSITPPSLAIILFDADNFKSINDNYGHDIGDKTLIKLAKISRDHMRKSDLVGRVGGEEFLIILPDTTLEQASEIAERLVKTIADTELNEIAEGFKITISAGVAAQEEDKSFSDLLQRADSALYRAKSEGRNRVINNTGLTASDTNSSKG